jgi:hypothetical protein
VFEIECNIQVEFDSVGFDKQKIRGNSLNYENCNTER